jgi:hypothetical protein
MWARAWVVMVLVVGMGWSRRWFGKPMVSLGVTQCRVDEWRELDGLEVSPEESHDQRALYAEEP